MITTVEQLDQDLELGVSFLHLMVKQGDVSIHVRCIQISNHDREHLERAIDACRVAATALKAAEGPFARMHPDVQKE